MTPRLIITALFMLGALACGSDPEATQDDTAAEDTSEATADYFRFEGDWMVGAAATLAGNAENVAEAGVEMNPMDHEVFCGRVNNEERLDRQRWLDGAASVPDPVLRERIRTVVLDFHAMADEFCPFFLANPEPVAFEATAVAVATAAIALEEDLVALAGSES